MRYGRFGLTGPQYDDDGGGGDMATALAVDMTTADPDSPPAASGDTGSPPIEAAPAGAGTEPEPDPEPVAATTLPLDRHEAILANARQETATALGKTSWANGLDPERVRLAISELEHKERDPNGYAQHLQQSSQAAQAPAPDLYDSTGAQFYSAEQAAKLSEHNVSIAVSKAVQALETKFEERFGPVEQHFNSQRTMNVADDQVAEATEKWPLFHDNIDAISAVIKQANEANQKVTLRQVYEHVVYPKLLANRDTLEKEIRAKIILEAQNANVTNDTDPARSTPAGATRPVETTIAEDLAAAATAAAQP